MSSVAISGRDVIIRHKLPPLKSLTALRFFAAMYVLIFHVGLQNRFALTSLPRKIGNNVLSLGYSGVILFFLLSGFILAYNYPSVDNLRDFWISRFARIYPVYFFALILCLIHVLNTPAIRYAQGFIPGALLSFVLLQSWYPHYAYVPNPPAWTLSVEALFYFVFPFVNSWVQRISGKAFGLMCVFWCAITCLPPLLALSPRLAPAAMNFRDALEGPFPLFRLPVFLIGMWLGFRFARKTSENTVGTSFSKPLALGIIGSLVLLSFHNAPLYQPVHIAGLTIAYGMLIYGLGGVKWRVLTNRWLQVAGEISYGIYILQVPVVWGCYSICRHIYPKMEHRPPLFGFPVLLVFSYLVFHLLEVPARLAIRRTVTHRPVSISNL